MFIFKVLSYLLIIQLTANASSHNFHAHFLRLIIYANCLQDACMYTQTELENLNPALELML